MELGIARSSIFDSRYTRVPVISASKPEFILLLTIARGELLVGEQSLLQELLTQTLDWEYLLTMASLHGLEPASVSPSS
jgi:hypothetical protein